MQYLDKGVFCTREEYLTGESSRLREDELESDELYMLMLAVMSSDTARQAAKKPARMQEVIMNSGAHCVKFAILDDDLNTEVDINGLMHSGYWVDAPNNVLINPGRLTVARAYFKGYEDDFDDEFQRMSEALTAQKRLHHPSQF